MQPAPTATTTIIATRTMVIATPPRLMRVVAPSATRRPRLAMRFVARIAGLPAVFVVRSGIVRLTPMRVTARPFQARVTPL